jgi:transcriptional regulator with XRE-family HTH domain
VAKKPASRRKLEPGELAVRFVADRVRQLREARGWSQEMVAAKAGVSAKFIGEIERGTTNTSIAVLWQLTSGLGVSLPEFFLAADDAAATDVATVGAIVGAQPPAARRQAIRLLRALWAKDEG